MSDTKYSIKAASLLLGASEERIREAVSDLKLEIELMSFDDMTKIRGYLGMSLKNVSGYTMLFLSFKGGTGKTTLSGSTAYRLAEMGYRVLAIDLDPQGHMTACFGIDPDSFENTLYNVLIGKKPVEQVIIRSKFENLDMIPGNISMSPVEIALVSQNARELKLRRALEPVLGKYNFIVMDAPPNFGLLNLNAILAADCLIIPVIADFLSYNSLKLIFSAIDDIKNDFGFILKRVGILMNYFNGSFRICSESKEALYKNYGDRMFKTIIRQSTEIARATSKGKTIVEFNNESKGAEDISSFIREIICENV